MGKEYCEVLSEAGAHVVIVDLDQKKCDKEAERITKLNGVKAIGIKADITDEKQVEGMVKKAVEEFGRINILINNAAVKTKNFCAPLFEYPIEDWQKVVDVNLTGMFLCAKHVGKQFEKQGKKGVIVNISSTYGVVGPDQRIYPKKMGYNTPLVYSATKSAVLNLTRYLAAYWHGTEIRVNTLTPGGVFNNQDPDFVKNYCYRTVLGRMARKDEYRGAILFLVSDASSYMTGSNLIIDGGWTCW